MKKVLTVVLCLCMITPYSLIASTFNLSGLSYEQIRQFNYERLSYDVSSGFMGNVGRYGSFSGSYYKLWIPYHGTRKINESTFFQIAGYTQEAEAARKYNTIRVSLLGAGIVAALIGSYIYVNSDYGSSRETQGLVLLVGGSLALSGGTAMFMSNKYPSNIADMAMQDYNHRLLESIRK